MNTYIHTYITHLSEKSKQLKQRPLLGSQATVSDETNNCESVQNTSNCHLTLSLRVMKNIGSKILLVSTLVLAQAMFLSTASASGDGSGVFLDGVSDNLNLKLGTPIPNVIVKCNVTDANNKIVGTQTSIDNGNQTTTHQFQLKDGSSVVLTQENDAVVVRDSPIDNTAIRAFGDTLEPYRDNPNARLLFFSTNFSDHSPGILSWKSKGPKGSLLKGTNYLEVRCVYLMVNGVIIKCLGCHFYFRNIE